MITISLLFSLNTIICSILGIVNRKKPKHKSFFAIISIVSYSVLFFMCLTNYCKILHFYPALLATTTIFALVNLFAYFDLFRLSSIIDYVFIISMTVLGPLLCFCVSGISTEIIVSSLSGSDYLDYKTTEITLYDESEKVAIQENAINIGDYVIDLEGKSTTVLLKSNLNPDSHYTCDLVVFKKDDGSSSIVKLDEEKLKINIVEDIEYPYFIEKRYRFTREDFSSPYITTTDCITVYELYLRESDIFVYESK